MHRSNDTDANILFEISRIVFLTQGCYLGASFKGCLSNLEGKPCFEFNKSQDRAKPLILQQHTAASGGGAKCLETTSKFLFSKPCHSLFKCSFSK